MNKTNKSPLTVDNTTKTLDKLRSFIFKMNAKPDSITRTFSKNIQVSIEDIDTLNYNVIEKIKLHCETDGELITRITIRYSNNKSYEYENWQKFANESQNKPEQIESITLKWSFMANMPQYEFPQPHNLVVKISSGLKFSEYVSLVVSGKVEDANDIDILDNTVVARVEFVNTLLGEELLNVISKWVDTCDSNVYHCNKILLFFRKYRNFVATCIENITTIILMITSFLIASELILTKTVTLNSDLYSLISKMMVFIGILYTIIYIIKKVSHKIAVVTYKGLDEYGEGYVFNISSGDKHKIQEKERSDKKVGILLFFKLILTFIVDLVCTILISYILS